MPPSWWLRGRELVLTGPADTALVVALRRETHGAMVKGTRQAVEHHRIDHALVADSVTGTGAGQKIRRIGHRLHAARNDDVGFARAHHEVGQVNGLQTRQADLVDGRCVDAERNARLLGRLTRRDLALSRLDDLTHQHSVDARWINAGHVEHALDGDAAELLGAQSRERPRKLSDGGATTRDDDAVRHDRSSLLAPKRGPRETIDVSSRTSSFLRGSSPRPRNTARSPSNVAR